MKSELHITANKELDNITGLFHTLNKLEDIPTITHLLETKHGCLLVNKINHKNTYRYDFVVQGTKVYLLHTEIGNYLLSEKQDKQSKLAVINIDTNWSKEDVKRFAKPISIPAKAGIHLR